ncbi:MAG: hypothetical protein LBF74_04105 [Treponema sp.]|nr:hypothetical protein [Treponema sp.]
MLAKSVFFFLLIGSLVSCDVALLAKSQTTEQNPGVYDPDYEGRETKTFYAMNTQTEKTYSITAVHLAENEYCTVYGELSAAISLDTAESIADEFKKNIHPLITKAFGDFREYLGDKDFGQYDKLTLFLLDIRDGYDATTNPSYVAGYFYPGDMYRRSQRASSNEAALLYLDVNPGKIDTDFFSAVAHEFQHLINYSIRMNQQGGDGNINVNPQNTWVDEGLASAAEYLYSGRHIEKKIDYFNFDAERRFSSGDTFFVWKGLFEDYCTVYLFFQWLRIQADGDPAIYKDIINSKDLDYRAVTGAAAKYIDGQFEDWETLLEYWLLANYVNASEGHLGYNNEISTEIRALHADRHSLAPGEGVFSYLDGTGFTPKSQSGSHIRYFGVTQAGELIDSPEGVFPSGQTGRILTFNANKQTGAPSEYGYLTGKVEPFQRRASDGAARGVLPVQGPWPIDIPPAFFLE